MLPLHKSHEIMQRFGALRRQEDGPYRCNDYLAQGVTPPSYLFPSNTPALHPTNDVDPFEHIFASLPSDPSAGELSAVWRERICEWCYQVRVLPFLLVLMETLCQNNQKNLTSSFDCLGCRSL